jgi:hypothetical protein
MPIVQRRPQPSLKREEVSTVMSNKEEIASEMHRWGRMTGAFSIIVMVTWVVLGTATTTGFLAARSSLLWPGVALAILAVIGLFGGFGLDYLASRKR